MRLYFALLSKVRQNIACCSVPRTKFIFSAPHASMWPAMARDCSLCKRAVCYILQRDAVRDFEAVVQQQQQQISVRAVLFRLVVARRRMRIRRRRLRFRSRRAVGRQHQVNFFEIGRSSRWAVVRLVANARIMVTRSYPRWSDCLRGDSSLINKTGVFWRSFGKFSNGLSKYSGTLLH